MDMSFSPRNNVNETTLKSKATDVGFSEYD